MSYVILSVFLACFVSDFALHRFVFPFIERPQPVPSNVTSEKGNETLANEDHGHLNANESVGNNQSEPQPPEIEAHEGDYSSIKVHIHIWYHTSLTLCSPQTNYSKNYADLSTWSLYL